MLDQLHVLVAMQLGKIHSICLIGDSKRKIPSLLGNKIRLSSPSTVTVDFTLNRLKVSNCHQYLYVLKLLFKECNKKYKVNVMLNGYRIGVCNARLDTFA